jgi:hypothetical protein
MDDERRPIKLHVLRAGKRRKRRESRGLVVGFVGISQRGEPGRSIGRIQDPEALASESASAEFSSAAAAFSKLRSRGDALR